MEYNFAYMILFQISLFTCIGCPLSLYLSREFNRSKAIAILFAAPIFGIQALLFFGLIGLKLQVSQYLITIFLSLGSLILSVYLVIKYWNENYENLARSIGIALLVIFGITCASIILYTSDSNNIEFSNYFPLTNSDTFAYLGQIDQIKFMGVLSPQYEYPAGFYAIFSSAVNLRAAVTTLVAGQSDFFSLDTHMAFFSTIRCVIPLVTIGIFSILILSGIEIKYSIFGTIMFLGGNFCFNQIFQQFLSSAYGNVSAIGLIIFVILALQSKRKNVLLFLGGLVSGVLTATSPEAHPFYLLILFCFYFILVLFIIKNVNFSKILENFFYYVLGLFCGLVTLIPGLYIDLCGQSRSLMGHSGDWVAQIGFFFQTFGILPAFIGNPLSTYDISNIILILIIFIFVVISPIYVIIKLKEWKKSNDSQLKIQIFLGVLSSVFILSFLSFLLTGRGYALQKVSEYFCFVPAIMCSVVLNDLETMGKRNKKVLIAFQLGVFIFLLVFLSSAIPQKIDALNTYHNILISNPEMNSYSLAPLLNDSVKSVEVDMRGITLDLFLYKNRMTGLPISFLSTDTDRFYRKNKVTPTNEDWVFRMTHPPTREGEFMDINQPSSVSYVNDTQLMKRNNYIIINSSQSYWVTAEGRTPSEALRWLSREGYFSILSCNPGGYLHLKIYPGPDLNMDNRILITINEFVLIILTPDELPKEINLKLPNITLNSDALGKVQIIGSFSGIRQIRLGGLYIDNTSESIKMKL